MILLSSVDVTKIAGEVSKRLDPLYLESVKSGLAAVADEDGSISRTGLVTVEIEMLRRHLEQYVTELVSEVVRQIDAT